MNSLTELGRREICRLLGDNNENSIFVKDKEAFCDRMELYRSYCDIDHYVDVYKTEMLKFKSEEKYVEWLDSVREAVADYVIKPYMLEDEHDELHFKTNPLYRTPDSVGNNINVEYILSIKLKSPVFDCTRFSHGRMSKILFDNYKEFMEEQVGSKFLALYDDIQLEWITNEKYKKALIGFMRALRVKMKTIVCDRYLNKKTLIYEKGSELRFISIKNKSVESINNLYKALTKFKEFSSVEIELYKENKLADNDDITEKEFIIPSSCCLKQRLDNYNQITLNKYLRKITGTTPSEYDKYIDIDGNQCIVTNEKEINWLF